ncbi:MAG: Gfo/Idh/MocA family oxidoreductase [Candidatus Sumerlaeota bacterium]|nr:Gfo/Idh/MocA family oxidoreductase [Candidatus Sumerlaeota bacterium]
MDTSKKNQSAKDQAQNSAENKSILSRRGFIGGAAMAAAFVASCASNLKGEAAVEKTASAAPKDAAATGVLDSKVEIFNIVPRNVLGGPNVKPPSEKLNVAGVGIGGKGAGDVEECAKSENIVALCDVDDQKGGGQFKKHPKAKQYRDYRVMLEKQKDIDAIIVATPDHMHAPISIAAMQLGKHVYCQKPLTHTVVEARKMAEAARQYKVATQMGNQGLAGEDVRIRAEFLWAGAIGQVREVHIWTDRPVWAQGIDRPVETPPVPASLDWDLWLGCAPVRPYHPAYHPFAWRGWFDFGTGALGDIGCHSMAPVFKALNLGHPTTIEACASNIVRVNWKKLDNKETYPDASIVRYHFPARGERPPVMMVWYDGGLVPARPPEMEPERNFGDNGIMYIGDKGVMLDGRILPEARMKEFKRPAPVIPRSIGHYQEWFRACKGGEAAWSNFEFAGMVTETVLLGNVALKFPFKQLLWDYEKMKITNIAAANDHLTKKYRQGFSI